ncbi:MAG: hypothetical protein E7Y34_02275 [Mycoplasma sp.]|nr:hypothetical protein [Mycoplasma sp.]
MKRQEKIIHNLMSKYSTFEKIDGFASNAYRLEINEKENLHIDLLYINGLSNVNIILAKINDKWELLESETYKFSEVKLIESHIDAWINEYGDQIDLIGTYK